MSTLTPIADSGFPSSSSVVLAVAEQPSPHGVNYRLQPIIADAMPIVSGHAVVNVPHDCVNRNLIFAFPGLCLKTMP
jgi:hypothetical protein